MARNSRKFSSIEQALKETIKDLGKDKIKETIKSLKEGYELIYGGWLQSRDWVGEFDFLEINNLKKGSMNLINSIESEVLLKNCKVIKKISGGSSANTVVCLAELDNNVQFIGLSLIHI